MATVSPLADRRWEGPWALLNDPPRARLWLSTIGLRDPEQGFRDLRDLARLDLSAEVVATLLAHLTRLLPRSPDAGMALTNLERFVSGSPDRAGSARLLAESPGAAEVAIQLFGTSQYFSEILIRDPDLLAWLRGGAERRDRDALVADLWDELSTAPGDEAARLVIRRFRRRELLRIGYNDIVRDRPLESVTEDLSHLADACVEAALRLARRHADDRHGPPSAGGGDDGTAGFVVLALGKLGGEELNYSSDIDLIFLYESEGQTAGPRVVSNAEYFARVGGELVRLLSDHTALGMAYRVDMRLRPEGDQGPLARSLAGTLGYYENAGRTWERQALIKCRPVAGDLTLGRLFLDAIRPFVYRRYLSGLEIGEIKAMKRRIEARTLKEGTAEVEVKTGRGGIRDVEFVVQFLQLLHGGEYPKVRSANTLEGMARLEEVGCLAADERRIMEDTYRFLRRVEHRLQVMFDRQTHEMPRNPEEQRILAVRLGYAPASIWEDRTGPAERFLADYRAKTDLNRKILNHLLHDAFRDDGGSGVDPVVDLVLDPAPDPEGRAAALAPFPFRDPETAYLNLMALAREESPFLSPARCRHFLAAIAPSLLAAVSKAPDPDMALTNLEKVSASLGAKAVLWELFSFNPPTLRLYVELCSTSQFLSEILIQNPGMIDDLMDSLVVDRSQPASAIRAELTALCRGAEDLGPILASFRNKEWVRIGTRDILGREPVRDVTRELADVAEAIVSQVARDQSTRRAARSGPDGRRPPWAIVALGKLGGRELNYHGDLDLVFLFDDEGAGASALGAESVGEVARRVLKALSDRGLYRVDTRLRPHGASGPLAVGLGAFSDYFGPSGRARAWERLALTRARVVFDVGDFGPEVTDAIRSTLGTRVDPEATRLDVLAMRRRLEEAAGPNDLKRGPGGLVDVEFLVQALTLRGADGSPLIARPNVWDALDHLKRSGALPREAAADLRASYDFLRAAEGRLRIVHNRAASEWPDDPADLARLSRRLGYPDGDAFRRDIRAHAERTRRWFSALVGPVGRCAGPIPGERGA